MGGGAPSLGPPSRAGPRVLLDALREQHVPGSRASPRFTPLLDTRQVCKERQTFSENSGRSATVNKSYPRKYTQKATSKYLTTNRTAVLAPGPRMSQPGFHGILEASRPSQTPCPLLETSPCSWVVTNDVNPSPSSLPRPRFAPTARCPDRRWVPASPEAMPTGTLGSRWPRGGALGPSLVQGATSPKHRFLPLPAAPGEHGRAGLTPRHRRNPHNRPPRSAKPSSPSRAGRVLQRQALVYDPRFSPLATRRGNIRDLRSRGLKYGTSRR